MKTEYTVNCGKATSKDCFKEIVMSKVKRTIGSVLGGLLAGGFLYGMGFNPYIAAGVAVIVLLMPADMNKTDPCDPCDPYDFAGRYMAPQTNPANPLYNKRDN